MSGIEVGQIGGASAGAIERAAADARGGNAERFASLLERAEGARDASGAKPAGADKARAAAEELVASTLVQPILAKLRETSTAAAPFAPGQWEKTFGPFMDAEISTRIVRASGWSLVDRMAEGFTRPGASLAASAQREEITDVRA